jgi:hypothetical protein
MTTRTGRAADPIVESGVARPVDLPSLGAALRAAATDFYFNSWRLAPANVVWGVSFVALLVVAAVWLPGFALTPLLVIPMVGISRMAALVVRGESVGFSDFAAGIVAHWRQALLVGAASTLLAAVFTTNIVIGLQAASPAGWLFGTLALYADIGLAMMLTAFWPILVDPSRPGLPLRRRLRLAAMVNLWRPGRMAGLTILLVAVLAISAVLFAPLLTISVAYVSLVATRYVLPLADRLEGRTAPQHRA